MTEIDGVAFTQRTRGRPNKVNQIEDRMKDKECYKCGQKVHIETIFTAKKINSNLDDDDRRKNSSPESPKIKNHSEKKKKEAGQFVQEDYEE